MNIKKTRIPFIFAIAFICCTLTGCDEVQIFKEKVDENAPVALKDTELENDTYYVKNNTRFYEVYMPVGNATSSSIVLDESRIMATILDDRKIPVHYSDEFIAFQSDKIDFSEVTLERFEDLGYTFGCYGGDITKDGYLHIIKDSGLIKDSSFYSSIDNTSANDIRIATIDGKPLSEDNIRVKCGVITGLEKNKSYKVGYYVGTRYFEKSIEADTKIYAAYEMFSYGSDYITDTPNGYMSFNTPTDLKSGYYNINGCGLFKYYNFPKGTQDEDHTDMNESYYLDERSKIEAYSRQYKVNVPKKVKDFKINIEYVDNENDDKEESTIRGICFAPDDTQMEMTVDKEKNTITISLSEAMAGDWTVNIVPKTLEISDISVESDKAEQEPTCEETMFVLPENRENIEFIAEYKFIGEVDGNKEENAVMFGNILTDDGRTYEMKAWKEEIDQDNVKYYISYELPFAEAGNYIMRIYHYPNETIIEKPIIQDKMQTDTEVFVIEG